MEYTFLTNQLDILNILINDSSISLKSIQNLKLLDNYIEFEIERRAFENVTRKKTLFWTKTYLTGKTSLIRIENVNELIVSGLTEQFMCNHFIVDFANNSHVELTIESTFGLKINLKTNSHFIIKLHDLKDSNFGKGTLGGIIGYTKDEWRNLLIKENYISSVDKDL